LTFETYLVSHPYRRHRQCLRHDHRDLLVPVWWHLDQSLAYHQLVLQSLILRGEVLRLDEVLHLVLGRHLDEVRHLVWERLVWQFFPCPGSEQTDCFQDVPSGAECPCPGLKKRDCYPLLELGSKVRLAFQPPEQLALELEPGALL
jgi:hypothetical protein